MSLPPPEIDPHSFDVLLDTCGTGNTQYSNSCCSCCTSNAGRSLNTLSTCHTLNTPSGCAN